MTIFFLKKNAVSNCRNIVRKTEYTPVVCKGSRSQELQRHLCAHDKSLSSGLPCHFLAGLCLTFSLPVHHNTKHHLDSTTFSKTRLYTKNHFRKNFFQKLFGRKATLKNHSHISIMRVAETSAQTLPQECAHLRMAQLNKRLEFCLGLV